MAGFVVRKSGCWQWIGYKSQGYGRLAINGRQTMAHRWLSGCVSQKEMHYICAKKDCVNPDHVISVTDAEHSLLDCRNGNEFKTHCPKGHPYDEENTYAWMPTKNRQCRICRKETSRRYELNRPPRIRRLTIKQK